MLDLYMRKLFDFSIPLDDKRFILLQECIHRYYDYILAETLDNRLLLRTVRILATAHLSNYTEYIEDVVKTNNTILHELSDALFDEADTRTSAQSFRDEYTRYLKYLEEKEAEDKEKDKDKEE